ncbi:gliding motility-associated C-terminal domain-containing protein [Ulvibacterium marinum]|uniref:Gliding motility-associated C-terminal domain-containing protein n=1 Tax=Ulvibacterium marinum TaxID=2419782 RepID=A0A3B0C4P0_9FLAO|nr:gliding motility-associated C-terminal domain-containing protein [Ulvibacterium marinum]RKN79498.1 gliding motility-associated C-terminal domain-containing protein [Ulvibacterium marinum]
MRKTVHFKTVLLLTLLWVLGSQMAQAQCDPNNFTVTVTEGICPNDGNIAVTLPGGSPCVGWQAILTNPGGLETVLNIPDTGGPVNFNNLAVGSYMVRLVNGVTVIQSPDNPIVLTSTYQAMNITSTNTAPSCPSGTDATLTIDINSGGNGPFEYTVTPPAPGIPQTFGPTPNRSHTFLGLNGGESVSFEVTDLGCSVSQTQNPVIADNTALVSEYRNATFQRKCSPDCGAYDVTFFTTVHSTNGITTIQQPGNATISINGGIPQDLALDNVNGSSISFTYPPGLDENVSYVLAFNDGCNTFGTTKTTLPVDDTLLTIDQEIAIAPDCSPIHTVDAISITSDGGDTYNMFCTTNSIAIEQETPAGSNVWVNVPLVGGGGNPLGAGSFSDYYTLPGEGSYRITGTDDCHSTSVEFSTLAPTNPLDAVRIRSSLSILEDTGAIVIDRIPGQPSSNPIPETTYTIRPVPFQSSITINPTQPFNLGGSYTLNFPLAYTTTINRSIIGDLPPGEYEITTTDICGNVAVQSYIISLTAQYNPEITAFSGCANSGSIAYDMNVSRVANSIGPPRVNTIVELWTDDGSGNPGTLLTDDIPESGLTGTFNNLTAGDYVIRFSNINFQSNNDNEIFSAATGNNNDREYWTAVTIAPFQSITAATAGAFCDFTDPSTGIIFTEITGGTPTYPINYELFATSDLVNPVMTYVETDPSMTSHLFENVTAGNYLVRITTPCDGVDLNVNLILAPITTTITADNNPICAPGGDVELSINLPTSIFDITWTDNLGNTVGLGTPVTVTTNATTTYTASYAIKPAFCPTAPINTNDITITVHPEIVQVGTETPSCNLLGTEYTLVVEVAGTGPYNAIGTGAPGIFAGNTWTSDPIPAGTDYSIDFTDANSCNTLNVAGTAPNCCVFDLNLTTSDIDLCLNPGPYSTTIANTTLGLTYEVRDQNGISFIPALTGIGNGGDLSINIPPLNVPPGGTDYQVFVTNGLPGCGGTLVDPFSFINGNPDISLNVTGDTVCEGDAATVTISNSQVGVTYQLLQSGVPLSPVVTGTGTGGDLLLTIPARHPQLATGTYSVEASSIGCSTATLNQSPLITVNVLPTFSISGPATCSPDLTTYSLEVTVSTGTVSSTFGNVSNTSGNIWSITNVAAGTDITLTLTDANSCVATLNITAPDCSCPIVNVPISGGDQSYCVGSAIPALTATVNPGETVDWYGTPTGGTPLQSGSTSYTPTSPGSYYAEARNAINNCISTSRTQITLTENALPLIAPAPATCSLDLLTYSLNVSVSSGTLSSSVGTVTNISPILWSITDVPAGTDILLTLTDANSCVATSTVTAPNCSCPVVNVPISGGDQSYCAGSAIPALTATVNPGETVDWYGTPTGGTPLLSGNTTFNPTAPGTYYAETRDTVNNCTSPTRTPIQLTENALPLITPAPATCSLDLLTYSLNVSVSSGTLNSSVGTITNISPILWSITDVPAGTDILLTLTDANSCVATSTVTAPNCSCPVVNVPTSGGDQSYCVGSAIPALTATVNPGETVDWYGTPTGGTPLLSGNTTYNPTAPGTYYAETRDTVNNCTSATRTPIQLIENVLPIVTFNDPANICVDASVLDLTAFVNPIGGNFIGTGVAGNNFDPATAGTGTHTLTYEFTDANGCTSSDTADITVTALLAQTGTATTSCALDGQSYILTVELNGTGPYNATGNGTPGTFASNTWTSDPIPAGTDYSIDFTDANGCNTVTVADVAPICCVFEVTCPTFPATTVECYEDIPTVTALTEIEFEALGNADGIIGNIPCGIIEITAANTPDTGNCNMAVIRTYTVTEYEDTNSNGIRDFGENTVLNTLDCTQNITVQDTTDPVFVGTLPIDITVECDAVPAPETLTATDNCGTAIVTFVETRTDGSCVSDYSLERTWTATDECGLTTTHTQTIAVQDTTDPVFVETLPTDFTMECDTNLPIAETLTAMDNCGTATVTFSEEILNSGCAGNYTVLRTWEATDACGNETVHEQMITVEDTSAPVFVEALPQNGFAECDAIPEAAVLTATDNCGTATVDFTETEVPGNCSSEYSIVRTWTATDDCGNETSHTQTVQLTCPVRIYNAVSANNNLQNDIFLLEGIDCFPNNQVEIFNRWGVKVFETNGYDNQNKVFKGYSEGRLTVAPNEKLPTGTYFYIVQYESPNNGESRTIQQSGYLYLTSDN